MIKLWIGLAFIAGISSNAAYEESSEQDDVYDDYYLNDMDPDLIKTVNDIFKTTIPDLYMNLDNSKEGNNDSEMVNYEDEKKFEEELENYVKNNKFDPKADGNLEDYQFEDNRSEVDVDLSNEGEDGILARPLSGIISNETTKEENLDNTKELPTDLSKVEENVDKSILEETKSILNEDTINEFTDKTAEESQVNDDNSDIFEETSKILEESYANEKTDKDNNNAAEEVHSASESDEDFFKQLTTTQEIEGNSEEDTVDKAYKDLMSDIDRLHGTWKKLNDNDEISEDLDSSEKKAGSESEDYEEISDDELEKIFNSASDEENEDKIDLFDEKPTNDAAEPPKTHKVLPYIDDALVASDDKAILPTSTDTISEEVSTSTLIQEPLVQSVESTPGPSNKMIIAKEDKLINEFVKEHKSVYDISASDVRNAINIRLTIDTPVEVTSPEYPSPYPTDNTVDWMFTGDGMGIELNITDFSINGHLGDYVLVKPGGVDVSGSTGIIFTYNLRTERRYRFLDVDKMFVRFVANRGNRFMRGFKLSARMVVPRPGGLIEPEPEPEPGMPDPPATITLNLGGISLKNFMNVEEEFRHIIADMATLYINTKGIDPGLNTTLEATQITSRALCFHNWPKFELCTEVQFGVPIVYDVERNVTDARLNAADLLDMWTYYSQRDPFAVRLRILGITEYQVPDDASVLTLWLVVAGGVVISAALLALALWRFSCFEDYTRMPVYGDADSVAEKRTLDLYPTPHQTLPPLYTETDYKWADDNFDTEKVDMGFSNKTFLREDSFEAPGASRDRYTTDV